MKRLLLLAALACSACATAPDSAGDKEVYREPVYRTGTNLPSGRETASSAKSVNPETLQNTLDRGISRPPGN